MHTSDLGEVLTIAWSDNFDRDTLEAENKRVKPETLAKGSLTRRLTMINNER